MKSIGTGFAHWWATIDWGNAPSWVAAILTSASLFLAISLLRRDQKRQTRANADSFNTWISTINNVDQTGPIEKNSWEIHFHAYNAGDSPVAIATVFGQRYREMIFMERFAPSTDLRQLIDPHQSISFTRKYNLDPSAEKFYVMFRDAASKEWRRDLRTGRYLTHWQVMHSYWRVQNGPWPIRIFERLKDRKPDGFDDKKLDEIPWPRRA